MRPNDRRAFFMMNAAKPMRSSSLPLTSSSVGSFFEDGMAAYRETDIGPSHNCSAEAQGHHAADLGGSPGGSFTRINEEPRGGHLRRSRIL
jgi:hypothetical protein